jgi:hypothetical protein
MRPSTPSNPTLRAMAGLGSTAAATPAPSQLLPALGGAADGAAGAGVRSLSERALTPAAASILSTLESMEKVRAWEGPPVECAACMRGVRLACVCRSRRWRCCQPVITKQNQRLIISDA